MRVARRLWEPLALISMGCGPAGWHCPGSMVWGRSQPLPPRGLALAAPWHCCCGVRRERGQLLGDVRRVLSSAPGCHGVRQREWVCLWTAACCCSPAGAQQPEADRHEDHAGGDGEDPAGAARRAAARQRGKAVPRDGGGWARGGAGTHARRAKHRAHQHPATRQRHVAHPLHAAGARCRMVCVCVCEPSSYLYVRPSGYLPLEGFWTNKLSMRPSASRGFAADRGSRPLQCVFTASDGSPFCQIGPMPMPRLGPPACALTQARAENAFHVVLGGRGGKRASAWRLCPPTSTFGPRHGNA
jgi:hypothetical protein